MSTPTVSTPTVTTPPVPAPVTAAQVVLAGVSALHLFIVVFTLTHQAELRRDIATSRPEPLDVEQIASTASTASTLALAVHIPLFVLTAFLAVKLRSGHPSVLRPSTVSQVFGIAFASLSTPPLHDLAPLVPVLAVASAAVIGLLWIPTRSREFFASHPRSRRSRRRGPLTQLG